MSLVENLTVTYYSMKAYLLKSVSNKSTTESDTTQCFSVKRHFKNNYLLTSV